MSGTGKQLALSAGCVVVALAGGWWILRSGPTTQPEEPKRPPKIVKTIVPAPANHRIHITAYGEVIPARRVVVEPQVSGHVIRQHQALRPGGLVKAGEELYGIDPKLTELELAEAEAELQRVKAVLAEARRKLDEGQRLAEENVIPATELAALRAAVLIQEAEQERLTSRRERALELLDRHTVRAPFNAFVLSEAVELGQRVTPGDATATLVGTDEFWVRTAVPTDQLRWIRFPHGDRPGTTATVEVDAGGGKATRYSGEIVQLLGDLEEAGRMARVLVRVEDPWRLQSGEDQPPLLLGSYARVAIDAGELRNVLAIDRAALREGNRVWVADADQRLQVRDAKVRWLQGETAYVAPLLQAGEALIVSDLRVALPGMPVQAQSAEAPAMPGAAPTPDPGQP